MSEEWRAKLFECHKNIPICLLAFVLYPIGPFCIHLTAAAAALGQCCVPCSIVHNCWCFGFALNRGAIRGYWDIKGSWTGDYCTWLFCPCCASVQELREFRIRNGEIKEAIKVLANQ